MKLLSSKFSLVRYSHNHYKMLFTLRDIERFESSLRRNFSFLRPINTIR